MHGHDSLEYQSFSTATVTNNIPLCAATVDLVYSIPFPADDSLTTHQALRGIIAAHRSRD